MVDFPKEFGFRSGNVGGTLSSRTIMSAELSTLLTHVPNTTATKEEYWSAIIDRNILGKKTLATRKESAQRLTNIYALDPTVSIFRLLRFFWEFDPAAHPILTILCACAREPLIQASVSPILTTRVGEIIDKLLIEHAIKEYSKDTFSSNTLGTIVRNILSSWTQSGHLSGKNSKARVKPPLSIAATTYALMLGYLSGARGEMVFTTMWAKIIDQPPHILIAHAQEASRRGWITFRNVGNIMDIDFSTLLSENDRKIIYDQN